MIKNKYSDCDIREWEEAIIKIINEVHDKIKIELPNDTKLVKEEWNEMFRSI